MNKQQKIDKIESIHDFFLNSINHGSSGSSWWYPTQNVVAYNIKMSSFINDDDFKKSLSKIQLDFYPNMGEKLWDVYHQTLEVELDMLKEDIQELDKKGLTLDFSQAGRSGGWLEIEYNNLNEHDVYNMSEYINDYTSKEIDSLYKEAIELESLEIEIAAFIKNRISSLNEYIESQSFIDESIENLFLSDDEILEHYQDQKNELTNKIKSYESEK